jgi:hypothetical protein
LRRIKSGHGERIDKLKYLKILVGKSERKSLYVSQWHNNIIPYLKDRTGAGIA